MEHAKLPWDNDGQTISDADDNYLMYLEDAFDEDIDFIIEAVNCHDELVEALRYIVETSDEVGLSIDFMNPIENARAILAKVDAE